MNRKLHKKSSEKVVTITEHIDGLNSFVYSFNISKLKKGSRSSWKSSFEGKEMLGLEPEITLQELPYHAFKDHIDRFEYLAGKLKNDHFRYPLMKKQSTTSKLLFIFRYEWEFGKKSAPFKHKWIYHMYNDLCSEKDLQQLWRKK